MLLQSPSVPTGNEKRESSQKEADLINRSESTWQSIANSNVSKLTAKFQAHGSYERKKSTQIML